MKVHSSSTLMRNHVAGRPLAAQREVAVAYAADRSPLLFALDDTHGLTVTLSCGSSTTGWSQIDLSAQLAGQGGLGPTPSVQCFAVSQESGGSIWLVVAAGDTADGASKVFLTRKFSNGTAPTEWASFAQGLVPREVPADTAFTELVLGSADDGNGAPHIVGAAMTRGMMKHYQINPDPSDSTWTCDPLVLPQNATECLSAAAGNLPGLGRGVYALCRLGTLTSLTFTTLPEIVGGKPITQSRQLKLPAGFTVDSTMAMCPLSTANGQTELYLSGAGLFRYSLSAQQRSNQSGEQIADAKLFSGTSALVASGSVDGEGVDIWTLNEADLLVHLTGTASGDTYTWRSPAYLLTEATALAGFRAPAADGAVATAAAVGRSDGSLAVLVKDSTTDLWSPQTISVETRETVLELTTYTTRIVVTDDDGVTASSRTVHLRADSDVAALVNGQYYSLKRAVAKPVTTDPNGVITIVLETANLSAPVYTITFDTSRLDTAATTGTVTADAGADVRAGLRAIKDGTQIANAQRSDGKALFPNGADEKACAAAATGVQELLKVHDDLADPTRVRSARALAAAPHVRLGGGAPAMSAFGVRHSGTGVEVLRGEQALAAQAVLGNASFFDPGDLLAALRSGAESVGEWFINAVEDGYQFVVHLGDQVASFIFELASQAIAAVDWVLQHTLGITLEDIVAWLGYMFDWGDILKNHKVLAHILNLGLDHAVAQVAPMKKAVADAAATVRSKLVNDRLIVSQSDAIFADRARTGPPDPADTTQSAHSSWGAQQMTANGGSTSIAPVTLGDLNGVLAALTEREAQVFRNAADQFQTLIIEQFDDLTWAQILDEFLQIVGSGIINTIENVALTALDAVAVLVAVFKQMLNARWDIPVLTYVYEQIICGGDGSELTMLDLMCLLIAIPATVACKASTPDHRDMFTDATAAAVLRTTTWEGMLKALTTRPTRALETSRSASDEAPAEILAAAVMQLAAGTARTGACVFYFLREYGGPASKDTFNWTKIGFDWATWILGMVNLGLVTATTSDTTSARYVIDSLITSTQLLIRVKDTFLASWKAKTGADSPIKPILCYIEVGFGAAILIGTCVSIGLQSTQENPPAWTTRDVWNTQLAFKFIQNCMTGLYRILAFVPVLPDVPPQAKAAKEVGIATRGAMLIVRALASDTLAIVGVVNTVAEIY